MAEVAKQHENDIFVHGEGPSGTNFGGGSRTMKLHASLDTKAPRPQTVRVDCAWIAWDGKHHKTIPFDSRSLTVSASSPQQFELVDDKTWGRTDGATKGVVSMEGTFRGWVISVYDAGGKKIAGASNIPEFNRLTD